LFRKDSQRNTKLRKALLLHIRSPLPQPLSEGEGSRVRVLYGLILLKILKRLFSKVAQGLLLYIRKSILSLYRRACAALNYS
ncbi:hypothetical protein Q766_14115, partial [Flavobacterium subsaxonicum WB 4.1-42 = DSM 21790]